MSLILLKQLVSSFFKIISPYYITFAANVDYDQSSKEVVFNPNDVIKCVEIDTTQDTILENVERFRAVLILPAETTNLGVTPGDRTQTPISIQDDDGKSNTSTV